MNKSSPTSSGGIVLFKMMFIVLFVGKVFEIGAVADWSWWLITAPLWAPTLLVLSVTAVFLLLAYVLD